MHLKSIAGSVKIRRSTPLRTLFIDYPNGSRDILVDLFTTQCQKIGLGLTTTSATSGIEVIIPADLAGMFYLKIEDGERSFLQKLGIQ
jgi:hypothetical protein